LRLNSKDSAALYRCNLYEKWIRDHVSRLDLYVSVHARPVWYLDANIHSTAGLTLDHRL